MCGNDMVHRDIFQDAVLGVARLLRLVENGLLEQFEPLLSFSPFHSLEPVINIESQRAHRRGVAKDTLVDLFIRYRGLNRKTSSMPCCVLL